MKISTAIALGSTMIRGLAGRHLNNDRTAGCAWGMVEMAVGKPAYEARISKLRHTLTPLKLPCGCEGMIVSGGMQLRSHVLSQNLENAIVHLFNDHVMTRQDWSLEKLIDWVASVEPPDPEEAPVAVQPKVEAREEQKELVCP